jgi:CheY-like chemotaxis protein
MPKMTGIECARELRRMGCKIFIVGATGNALKEDQDEVRMETGRVVPFDFSPLTMSTLTLAV